MALRSMSSRSTRASNLAGSKIGHIEIFSDALCCQFRAKQVLQGLQSRTARSFRINNKEVK
eukprot:scaffold648915_cov20-Prasinocladus_malaysianus.AAC.1